MTLTIRNKLALIGAIVVIGLAFLFALSTANNNKILKLQTIQSHLKDIQNSMLQLRRNEKDFLLRKDLKYKVNFNITSDALLRKVAELKTELVTVNVPVGKIADISKNLKKYEITYNKLINSWVKKGLNKVSGHLGKLRAATHNIEESISRSKDISSQVLLLTVRRHEKDFMLRSEERYIDNLRDTAAQLSRQLGLANTEQQQELDLYLNEITDFLNISKKIGLTSKLGIQGEMRGIIHNVEEALELEVKRIEQYIDENMAEVSILYSTLTLLFSLFIVGSIIFIARQIIKPLKTFSDRIVSIRSANDLSQRVTESNDEVGRVAKEFNGFMEHFQSLVSNINSTVLSLRESTEDVSKSVHKTTEGLMDQASESDMVATAITEMGAAANEIANNALNTRDKTDQAVTNASIGQNKLDSTIKNINQLSDELINAGSRVNFLQEKSIGITSVLEVIKSIADQTNLLALNAAIEAARAGEQGRGFAVVADEVRTLALRTQDSTSEIGNIIKELQSTTINIVNTVNQCKDKGLDSVAQAKETERFLHKIISDVSDIADMTVEVATSVEEQSSVVQEVDRNIIRIRDIGVQVSNESQNNASASDKVAHLANTLHQEAKVFIV